MNKKMKRTISAVLCLFLFTGLLVGCTQNQPSENESEIKSENKSENSKSSDLQEENYDYTDYTDHKEDGLGITLKLPSKYLKEEIVIPGKYEIMFGDISLIGKDIPKAETDPSDHMDLFFMPREGEFCLFRVLAYPAKKWDDWMNSGKKATDITGSVISEEIFRKDGTVYIYDLPKVDTSTLDSNLKETYDEFMEMLPAIKASIKPTTVTMSDIGSFSANDLNGEAVDSTIFSEYKLTMINIWATFCRPCIKEMPDLQKMSEDMPEGTQLISIVGDANDEEHLQLAKKIANDAGVTFKVIIPDDTLKQYIDNNIIAYPTTLFVDSTGKIVGEAIIGERDMSVYKEIFKDRLAQAGFDE